VVLELLLRSSVVVYLNVVEVRKLRKEFGNVVAVDDLSFDIREG
jgi:uncharacterized protein YlbG (UPF0298 family)